MKELIWFPLFTQKIIYTIGFKVEILENGAKFLSVSVTLLMDKNCIENKQKEFQLQFVITLHCFPISNVIYIFVVEKIIKSKQLK